MKTIPYSKRLLRKFLFGSCLLLLFVVFSRHEPASSAVDSTTPVQLAPGATVQREISNDAAEVFEITTEPGKLLRLSINKGDLVLSTAVYGPTGATLLKHISQELETVEISLPADVSGSYKIELRARETLTQRRPYELRVELFDTVTASERRDSEARKLLAAAEVLRANFTAPDLRQARDKFDKAAATWTSIADYSNASLATVKAGDVCFLLSEFTAAGQRYQNAASLAEKKPDRFAQGVALGHLGLVNSYMGDNDLAQEHLNQALDFIGRPEDNSTVLAKGAYGKALTNMAEVTYSKGDLPKALNQFNEALRFLDQDRKTQAKVYRFAGYVTGSLGDADAAWSKISQARELSLAINDKEGEALALTLLGLFHSFQRHHDLAIRLHQNAITIFRTIGDRHGEAIALNGLGQAYQESDRSYALTNYEKALSLFESAGALDFVAVTTFKLGTMYVSENPELALKHLERCLTLSRAGRKVRNEANALSEIAIVYASHDRPDLAAKQHQKVLQFYETIGDHRGQAIALNNYGDFLLKLPQNQKALGTYLQALPLSEKVKDKRILTTTLYNLARAQKALGNYDAGLSYVDQSLDIIEDLRTSVGSPELRALYFSGVRQYYDLCRDILMQLDRIRPGEGFAERAFLVSEKSRARALLDLVQESRARLREGATAELVRSEREAGGSISSLTQYQWSLSLDGKKDSSEFAEVENRLAELRAQYQDIQARLRTQNPSQLPLLDFELKNREQIQKELPAGDILLEYSLGEEQSYLWAITSDAFHSYLLPSRRELENAAVELSGLMMARAKYDAAAEDYQLKVEEEEKLYLEKARDLSRVLLGPVADQLENRRLIFVTEGALQRVQFESLPVPRSQTTGPTASPELLINTNEIAAIPSMTTLMAMRAAGKRPASTSRLVAIIADPVFNRSDDRVSGPQPARVAVGAASLSSTELPVLRDRLSRLVYASQEADSILAVAPRGTTMVAKGFDASRETAMSSRVGEYQIVHFATHGFFDSENPESSGILLTNVDKNGGQRDGLMALHDIYNLDLSAELTVLSACQTALGKDIKGEGLVGLTHSFMSAGSKSVVASLWKVDDRATAALMSDFYDFMFRKGMPPVAALRAAKLKMMQDKRWQAPYFWAGFVFQGDYESRLNVGSNSHLFLGMSLLLVVLISSGLIVFLRRKRRLSPGNKIEPERTLRMKPNNQR
jgi:CHAT domain-containing protein